MTRTAILLLVLMSSWSSGCAALTNPVADGIPVRRVPAEILGRPKADLIPTPLSLLRQPEPEQYLLDKGDILAVVADDILNAANQQVPIQLPSATNPNASVGIPVPVRDDGTIALPRLQPIPVKGKTIEEAEQLVSDYATGKLGGKELVKPGATRLSVQLLQRRQYQIMVIREDRGKSGSESVALAGGRGSVIIGTGSSASGLTLRLAAYENDVLRALNASGGPPGFDAKDEVVLIRGNYDPNDPEKNTVRIPMRVYPDQTLKLRPEDIILDEGDIMFIENRDTEVYYTAGIIGGGQYPLPKNYDLRVLEAIAQIRGPLVNGGFSQNAFVAQSVSTGIGNPSPSLCTVIRTLPGGEKLPIRVDLNIAYTNTRENILIQPGDMVVLQERPGESLARYLTQTLRFGTSIAAIRQSSLTGNVSATFP